MSLLWNLFCAVFLFLLSSVALAAVLAYHKRIYHAFLKFVAQWKRDVRKKGVFLTIQAEERKILASIRKNWTISAVIFIMLVVFLIVNPFNEPVFPLVERGGNGPQWTPWGELFARIAAPLFVFIISLLGFYRIFKQFDNQAKQMETQAKQLERQAENTQKQLAQMERQEKNAQKQMAAEQFKNAIDHLGNEKQSVVLGGVHALHNLAMNFPDDYSKQVFEVLCSFIREETRKPVCQKKVMNDPVSSKNTQQATSLIVIQTIVDKLFREKVEVKDEKTGETKELYRNFNANLSDAFLRGVDFYRAELKGANLSKANLKGVRLWNAKLQGADIRYANLEGAKLLRAKLQGAKLLRAKLQGADLRSANLDEKNRQWLIEQGIFKAESQQPDDESIPDET